MNILRCSPATGSLDREHATPSGTNTLVVFREISGPPDAALVFSEPSHSSGSSLFAAIHYESRPGQWRRDPRHETSRNRLGPTVDALGPQSLPSRRISPLAHFEFASSSDFLAQPTRADLAIIDVRGIPPLSLWTLKRESDRVVLLTDVPGAYLGCLMLHHGFRGLLHLEDPEETLRSAILHVLRGGRAISYRISMAEIDAMWRFLPPPAAQLARQIALGRDPNESADAPCLNSETNNHASPSPDLRKRSNSQRETAVFALRHGLLLLS